MTKWSCVREGEIPWFFVKGVSLDGIIESSFGFGGVKGRHSSSPWFMVQSMMREGGIESAYSEDSKSTTTGSPDSVYGKVVRRMKRKDVRNGEKMNVTVANVTTYGIIVVH